MPGRAVMLATTAELPHTGGLSGRTAHQILRGLIDSGVDVFFCPSCCRQAGLSVENRLPGVKPGSKTLREIITATGTRIMSF